MKVKKYFHTLIAFFSIAYPISRSASVHADVSSFSKWVNQKWAKFTIENQEENPVNCSAIRFEHVQDFMSKVLDEETYKKYFHDTSSSKKFRESYRGKSGELFKRIAFEKSGQHFLEKNQCLQELTAQISHENHLSNFTRLLIYNWLNYQKINLWIKQCQTAEEIRTHYYNNVYRPHQKVRLVNPVKPELLEGSTNGPGHLYLNVILKDQKYLQLIQHISETSGNPKTRQIAKDLHPDALKFCLYQTNDHPPLSVYLFEAKEVIKSNLPFYADYRLLDALEPYGSKILNPRTGKPYTQNEFLDLKMSEYDQIEFQLKNYLNALHRGERHKVPENLPYIVDKNVFRQIEDLFKKHISVKNDEYAAYEKMIHYYLNDTNLEFEEDSVESRGKTHIRQTDPLNLDVSEKFMDFFYTEGTLDDLMSLWSRKFKEHRIKELLPLCEENERLNQRSFDKESEKRNLSSDRSFQKLQRFQNDCRREVNEDKYHLTPNKNRLMNCFFMEYEPSTIASLLEAVGLAIVAGYTIKKFTPAITARFEIAMQGNRLAPQLRKLGKPLSHATIGLAAASPFIYRACKQDVVNFLTQQQITFKPDVFATDPKRIRSRNNRFARYVSVNKTTTNTDSILDNAPTCKKLQYDAFYIEKVASTTCIEELLLNTLPILPGLIYYEWMTSSQ
jgi:hypothetical protein